MDPQTLCDIGFDLDIPRLMGKMRIRPETSLALEFQQLAGEAAAAAHPKAVYREVFIQERTAGSVTLDGMEFRSQVMSVILQNSNKAFAYVATAGRELDEWSRPIQDDLHRYWAEAVKEAALKTAFHFLEQFLVERYQLGLTAGLSPGSLPDWPLTEQKPLFELLGGAGEIGVELTPSCLMVPIKSISGIRFPVEKRFESCQLCSREKCQGRRAAFAPSLLDKFGLQGDPGLK